MINFLQNTSPPLDNSKCHPGVFPWGGKVHRGSGKRVWKETFFTTEKEINVE